MSTIPLKILEEYQDLNPAQYETYNGIPSPLEFMRDMVHISRPALFENCPLPLRTAWNDQYLSSAVGEVSVAVTPDGRADALTEAADGKTYFMEPLVEKMTMKRLLEALSPDESPSEEVFYLQSQNGNLWHPTDSEFTGLQNDLPRHISWATEALGRGPDAVNIWIGSEKSVTSVHSDPYENIYAVIRGTKIFTLFPPTEGFCLQERIYPHARWKRNDDGHLYIQPTPEQTVRWSSIRDPTLPLPLARPVNVVVREGQMLYLPAGWWHYVQQLPDRDGKCIAVNYWYDMEMRGTSWVLLSLLRSFSEASMGKE